MNQMNRPKDYEARVAVLPKSSQRAPILKQSFSSILLGISNPLAQIRDSMQKLREGGDPG